MYCSECIHFNCRKPLLPGQTTAICDALPGNSRRVYVHKDDECRVALKDTLPLMWHDAMRGYEVRQRCCVVCGQTFPINQHHVPPRSAGKVFVRGKELPKPTLTLCGSGNTSGCHGKAHHGLLHFRFTDRWEYLELDEPADRLSALEMDGWRPIREVGEYE